MNTKVVMRSYNTKTGHGVSVVQSEPRPVVRGVQDLDPTELGIMAAILKGNNREPSKTMQKAMATTGAGSGKELVGAGVAADEIWTDAYLQAAIAPLLFPFDMPADAFPIPIMGDVTFYKGAENTAISNPTTPSTDEVTLTATEILADIPISYTLQEDALASLMPSFRQALVNAVSRKMDQFAVNADATATATGNINLDDDTPAATAYYLSDGEDGIRHLYLVDNTNMIHDAGGDALQDTDVQAAIDKMGAYAADPRNALIILGPDTLNKALRKLESFTPLGQLGPHAEPVQGQVGEYLGIPVVVTSAMPKAEADGKCSKTAASNTLGQLAIVNRHMWRVGFRRRVMIDTKRNVQTRKLLIVVSFRMAIGCQGDRSAATHTAGVINILLS